MTRIGLDFRSIGSARKSGVENYIMSIAHGVPLVANDAQFFFFTDGRSSLREAKHFVQDLPNVKVIRIPVKSEAWFMFAVTRLSRWLRLDLFHFPIALIPPSFKIPSVINIYDLTYEIYPEFYSTYELKLQKERIPQSCRQAARILTISNATKSDLERFYGIAPEKIDVAYLEPRTEAIFSKGAKRPYPYPFVLCVGNVQPRKNFVRCVEAFARLDNPDLLLVIVGKREDELEYARIAEAIGAGGLQDKVHITGFVSNKTLGALYHYSEALLFPSIYEGFGLPIIEAFINGTPVITSQVSCMPEIAQKAAIYVDPQRTESIIEGLREIIGNRKKRAELTRLGEQRLAELKKASLPRQTYDSYLEALEDSK